MKSPYYDGNLRFFPKNVSQNPPPPFGPGDGGTPLHLWSDRDMPPSRVCFLTWQSLTGYEFLPKMTSKSLRGYIFWPLSLREGMYVDPSWTSKISLRVSIFVFSLFEGIYKWVLRLGAPPHVNPKHVPPGLRYLLRSSKFTLVALLFSSRRQSFHDARVVEPIELVHKTKMWIWGVK